MFDDDDALFKTTRKRMDEREEKADIYPFRFSKLIYLHFLDNCKVLQL